MLAKVANFGNEYSNDVLQPFLISAKVSSTILWKVDPNCFRIGVCLIFDRDHL